MVGFRTIVQRFPRTIIVVLLLIWCVGSHEVHQHQEEEECVVVSQGRLQGTRMTTRNGRNISAFLGIPYAKPPIGTLRFKNTEPPEPWFGTFVANKDGNQCPQMNPQQEPVGYEDCLYLNVFTPQANSSLLYPTMVFIHGGKFLRGNGSTTSTSPAYLLDKDIVLVTINYRLGVFGFLSTGDAEAPGNFGLKDQLMALQWVNKDIKAFGGDPNNVTIFGQSAGSASVTFHALSNVSQGFFKQFIAQSGSVLAPWSFNDISIYKSYSFKLGQQVNCATNNSRVLINCLQKIDVPSLLDSNNIFDHIYNILQTWVPTNEPELDGAFLTARPIDLLLKNTMKDCQWMTGIVRNEGLEFTTKFIANETQYNEFAANVDYIVPKLLGNILPFANSKILFENVKHFYFDGITPNDKVLFLKSLTNLVTDVSFLVPTVLEVTIVLRQSTKPIYFYLFDYRGTFSQTSTMIGSNLNIGITHTDDLIYLFPVTPSAFGLPNLRYNREDESMIDKMVDLWTTFASTGLPTSDHTTNPNIWKPYNNETYYLRIGKNSDSSLKLKKHLYEVRVHFWMKHLATALIGDKLQENYRQNV